MIDIIKASTAAVRETCQDKVLKVFNASLQLFNLFVSSAKLEQFLRFIADAELVPKFLAKTEDGNVRVISKVHEALIDFAFHPSIGEGFVATYLIARIAFHNKTMQEGTAVKEDKDGRL